MDRFERYCQVNERRFREWWFYGMLRLCTDRSNKQPPYRDRNAVMAGLLRASTVRW